MERRLSLRLALPKMASCGYHYGISPFDPPSCLTRRLAAPLPSNGLLI